MPTYARRPELRSRAAMCARCHEPSRPVGEEEKKPKQHHHLVWFHFGLASIDIDSDVSQRPN